LWRRPCSTYYLYCNTCTVSKRRRCITAVVVPPCCPRGALLMVTAMRCTLCLGCDLGYLGAGRGLFAADIGYSVPLAWRGGVWVHRSCAAIRGDHARVFFPSLPACLSMSMSMHVHDLIRFAHVNVQNPPATAPGPLVYSFFCQGGAKVRMK
jgi:hypothetical protein